MNAIKKIITLGPENTFSDIATRIYCSSEHYQFTIQYAKSIQDTLNTLNKGEAEFAVLPIENFSEGYISLVLDYFIKTDLFIEEEIILPIKFSLISNMKTASEIKKLYVQFVAKGQCSNFISSLQNIELVITESNIQSLNSFIEHPKECAAIVPTSAVKQGDFNFVVDNVNDFENNQTRFLVLSNKRKTKENKIHNNYKTTIIVVDKNDYPGFLGDVLSSFSKRDINLTSINSIPTKDVFGKYYFLIDFDGYIHNKNIEETLNELAAKHSLKILGSYEKTKKE